jgi:hypothetical protein
MKCHKRTIGPLLLGSLPGSDTRRVRAIARHLHGRGRQLRHPGHLPKVGSPLHGERNVR